MFGVIFIVFMFCIFIIVFCVVCVVIIGVDKVINDDVNNVFLIIFLVVE